MVIIKQNKDEIMKISVGDKLVFEGAPWDFPTNSVALKNFLVSLGMDVMLNTHFFKGHEPAKPVSEQGV